MRRGRISENTVQGFKDCNDSRTLYFKGIDDFTVSLCVKKDNVFNR